jgi:hypothetical protein
MIFLVLEQKIVENCKFIVPSLSNSSPLCLISNVRFNNKTLRLSLNVKFLPSVLKYVWPDDDLVLTGRNR